MMLTEPFERAWHHRELIRAVVRRELTMGLFLGGGLAFLRDSAGRMPTANHWQKQAVAAIIDDLYALQSDLTQRVVQSAEEGTPWDEVAEAWLQKRAQPVERIDQLIAELRALDHVDVSMLAVANRRLRGLMAG